MLPLLAVSLVLCLVGISGEGWEKKIYQKCRMSLSLPVFVRKCCPWCHVNFVKNERLECEIKVPLGYYSVFY